MNEKDAEYADITSWIFGDENEQEKLECKLLLFLIKLYIDSETSKMLKSDMKKNPNGNLLHLVLLSHALSSPIQVIKDKKMHENIGADFKGNPKILKLLNYI